jgi:hypothetical protein
MKLADKLRPAQLDEHNDPMYAGLETAPKSRIEKFMLDFAEGDDGLSIEIKARGYKAILRDAATITAIGVAVILCAVYKLEIYWFFKGAL